MPLEIQGKNRRSLHPKRSKTRARKMGQIRGPGSLLGDSIQVTPRGSIEIVTGCSFSVNLMKISVLGKGSLEVSDQISSIFEAHRNPDGAGIHAGRLQLRCGHSVVRCVLWEHNK